MADPITQVVQSLGLVTAYGYAKSKGYTGTEEEFAEAAAAIGQGAATASAAAAAASEDAETATTAAGTATTKAAAAASSATEAGEYKDIAENAAADATTSKNAAAGSATSAAASAQAAATSEYNAGVAAGASSDYALDSQDHAEDSEAWAVGTKNGNPVPETADQYHNNAKYYADLAETQVGDASASASAAAASATAAAASAVSAEAWATGGSGDTAAADNNAKYYAEQAAAQAEAAAGSAASGIAALANEAPTFSASTAYTAGEYVLYNSVLYRFAADHAAGAWTGTDAAAVKLAEEVGDLNTKVDDILADRNETPISITTSDYHLINAAIVNGIIQTGPVTQVATEKFIDCRGIKYLEFHNTDKWIYFSWYSEPNESAFVSNSDAWWKKDNLKVIPVNNFLRIAVRNPDGTIVQPSFGGMVIDMIGVIDYNAIVDNKQAIAPYGYKVVNVNDKFVRGGISTTGEVVSSSTSICTPNYIDTKNAKTLYVSVPEGYSVALVFFEFQGTKEVQRILNVTGNRYVSIKNGYNYVKIGLYSNEFVYTGESKELSIYLLSNCHGYDTQTDTQSGTVVYGEYIPGSELRVNSEESSTVIISNKNILVRDYYEASKTVNGIAFTVNDNGSITANGTATANADFFIRKTTAPTIYLTDTPLFFQCLSAPSEDYFAYLHGSSQADLGNGVRVSLSGVLAKITSCYIRIRSGKTVNNVTFYPMLSVGTEKAEYTVSRGYVYNNITNAITTAMRGQTVITASSEISVQGEVSINRLVELKHEEIIANQKQHGWRSNNHIVSICHRGYLTEAPENTIYAFRAAVADDIDYLESDIWFTSDHVPVMFHDPTINRVVTGHTGTIRDYTWAEVQTFDVYTYFHNQYPDKWKPEFENARIMSFEDYLKFCKGVNTPTMLEIKDPNCSESERQSVINLIKKYDFADCILWFGSLASYPNLYSIINAFPNALLNLGVDGTTVTQYHINLLNTLRTGENNVGIATDNYTSDNVAICKANNVPLTVYMIDTLQKALALDPYIHAAISNNQNVRKVLKDYYMGDS